MQKCALVCGAGGFIGGHLVKRLVSEGYYVRGVDKHRPSFSLSGAQEFYTTDLRRESNCRAAIIIHGKPFDEVYQLSASMGGMGFIHANECEIMHDNSLINMHMTHSAAEAGVGKYFFSSSACVYPDQNDDEPELSEAQAEPMRPDNEYGLEKLWSERVLRAYGRKFPMAIRVGRFQNCFGPECAWRGGREKAPAAICRKVAEAPDGGAIEIWGDGSAMRAYTYVTDMLDGIRVLMTARTIGTAEHPGAAMALPFNIGRREYVSVDQLAKLVIEISGKDLSIFHADGPVGVQNRGFRTDRIEALGWTSKVSLKEGLTQTYLCVEGQLRIQS
jgi:nucleoside-diphosphate-sugar epimerase